MLNVLFSLVMSTPLALAGTSMVHPEVPKVECEYRLVEPQEYLNAGRWFRSAVSSIQGPDFVFSGYAPQEEAYRALGLPVPFPAKTRMRIKSMGGVDGLYQVQILADDGEEIAGFEFRVPAYIVWKQVENIDNENETTLKFDLNLENPNGLSIGTQLGEFPGGRTFISVRRRQADMVTISIGVDTLVREHKTFSESPVPRMLVGSDDKIYSRIEVIKAHFKIPVRAPRRRGPTRIT